MPITTVEGAFDELLKRIEMNPGRSKVASERYQAIKETLEAGLAGCKVFQIGSFQRHTKIRPDNDNEGLDIDVGVCISDFTDYAPATPSAALTKVQNALEKKKTYRAMNPRKDAPTVILEYGDGLKVEIVPCYRSVGRYYPRLTGPKCYIVGKDSNNWQPADYDYDAQIISGLNQIAKVKQVLVPSIKLVKKFLRNRRAKLKSFHIEVLCAAIIPTQIVSWENGQKAWKFRHILAGFLSDVNSQLRGPINLAGSNSVAVDSGMSGTQLSQIGAALRNLGDEAWRLCKLTDSSQTLEQWAKFYGDPFPKS